MAFEDETTITQKPCIHKSMSFEGQQQRIEHNGSRRKFSAYISMLWPEEKLMTYDFYDRMNSTSTIDHLENLKRNIMKNDWWKRLILIWDNASYHVSLMGHGIISMTERRGLADHYSPTKESTIPNQMKGKKSADKIRCVCKQILYADRRTESCSIRLSREQIWNLE